MSEPLGFLDLPAETRLLIYEYVASESSSIVNQPLPAAAALLRTCRTVHGELLVSLFSSKKVVLDTHGHEYLLLHAIRFWNPGEQLARLNPLARENLAHITHKVHLQYSLSVSGSVFELQQKQLGDAFDQCANLRTVRLEIDHSYEQKWLPTLFGFAVWMSEKINTSAGQVRLNLLNLNIGPAASPPPHSIPTEWVASFRRRVKYCIQSHGNMKLPPLLHTVDIISPARRGPGKQALDHDDLPISNDLILSLPLPYRHSVVMISDAAEDDRWVYEMQYDQPDGVEQEVDHWVVGFQTNHPIRPRVRERDCGMWDMD